MGREEREGKNGVGKELRRKKRNKGGPGIMPSVQYVQKYLIR